MDPSQKYPVWYKNIVSLWILFGMAWQALIIKMILSLLEMPGVMSTCSLHCSKGAIKGQSWRQGQEGEHGSNRQASHLEPFTQVMWYDEDS